MTARRTIPEAVLEVQNDASDPNVSAWVSANAGSGKTHVLALRVIKLMLDEVDPAKILCITFTKAAAANMANRVFSELRKWTALDDDALDAAIGRISNIRPTARVRARARRLFATALETPGGLKVQTIHAFCTHLLHLFPFEANVAARFTVLDETAQTQLLNDTSLHVLLDAAARPDQPLGLALQTAIAIAADQTFKDVVSEAIGQRDAVTAWVDQAGGVEAAIAALSPALGVTTDDTMAEIEGEILNGPILPPSRWKPVAALLAQGNKSDNEQANRLLTAADAEPDVKLDAYLGVFLTQKGEARARLVTQAMDKIDPTIGATLNNELTRLLGLIERRKAIAIRDRTEALITIADEVIRRYREAKDRRGLLDYDDLIDRTLTMFERVTAAWVLYKLDLGIDHVLIDEAQDTSPKQWEIITRLTEEFAAGEGARGPLKRTIFAVGDEKQSIFSFQGAAPHAFAEMRRHFQRRHEAREWAFRYCEFKHSFRSGASVLGAVDAVFKGREIALSITSDEGGIPPHLALPDAAPGLVEIWPLTEADDRHEIEPWDAPFDAVAETSPQVKLARRIADTISRWMRAGRRAGDVLVLVRQRGTLFEAIIRALKDRGVPVAGADRLILTEHIAVMDLMVLADALLLPDDDLALATVLKSPLFGFDDDDLFAIAWQRKGSLWSALRAKADGDQRFVEAVARLDRYQQEARRRTPFDFYSDLLGADRGRKRIRGRLGPEADDALDEFLNLALDYEQRETPSLQGFIAWLRTASVSVKRDMEITRDEVRVMTVHGAKGLEAPLVILADTTTQPTGPRTPRLLSLPMDRSVPGAAPPLVWAGARADDVGAVAQARGDALAAAEDEYRRLLYVAMTRAADTLVVCGVKGVNKIPDGCWYQLVDNALAPLSQTEPADDGDGEVLRFRKPAEREAEQQTKDAADDGKAEASSVAPAEPDWLWQDVRPEPGAARPLSPSAADDRAAEVEAEAASAWTDLGPGTAGAARQKALARGRVVHRLLQSLPDVPRERAERARRYLAKHSDGLTPEECEIIADQVLALIEDPQFKALFAPGSRAEVSIAGREPVPVAGQVDRLVVTENEVLIADYKTNRPPPTTLAEVPEAYVRQLALYRAVLAKLYPAHTVRALLVWTEVLEIIMIPAADLDAALARVISP